MFREMCRKKQALEWDRVVEILTKEKRGVLSVHGEQGYPYGLPMNFYFNEERGTLYFHTGRTGHKIDAIQADNKVSFCVYDQGYRKEGEWALNICSVILFGRMYEVPQEEALPIYRALSLKFTDDTQYIESEIEKFAKNTRCFELRPDHISGKLVNEA